MKILIFGASGLLGAELANYFRKNNFEVLESNSKDADITKSDQILEKIKSLKPDVIINCAVIVSVDICESDINRCFEVNRNGVLNILNAIKFADCKPIFIQISSSEVFGRVNKGEYNINGYKENEIPKPVSAYQRSKTEAEKLIANWAKNNPNCLEKWFIARAGWLYGKGRKTFIDNFVTQLQRSEPLKIIKDQWRSPTWTKYFAIGLNELISKNYENGIYHIVNEVKPGEATTIDVIEEIKKYLGEKALKQEISFVSQQEFFKVPRAPSNVILNTKLPKLPYWRDALQEYLKENY